MRKGRKNCEGGRRKTYAELSICDVGAEHNGREYNEINSLTPTTRESQPVFKSEPSESFSGVLLEEEEDDEDLSGEEGEGWGEFNTLENLIKLSPARVSNKRTKGSS
jgi:hypothetical protein